MEYATTKGTLYNSMFLTCYNEKIFVHSSYGTHYNSRSLLQLNASGLLELQEPGLKALQGVAQQEPSQAQLEIKELVDSPSVLKTSDSDRLANVGEME